VSLIGTVPKSIDFVNFDLRSPRTAETRSCGKNCWKSWKLIARTISQTPLLFVTQRLSIYSQRYMGKFGETRGGVGKLACWSTKAAISLKQLKLEEKLLWRAYQRSFEWYHPRPRTMSSSPRLGFATPTQTFNRYCLKHG